MKRTIVLIVGGVLLVLIIFSAVKLRQFRNTWFKDKPNYLSFTSVDNRYTFEWAGDSLGKYYEPYIAMVFPTKFEDVANKFTFQFDTGAPTSTIRGNVLQSLIDYGLDIEIVRVEGQRFVKEIDITLGDNRTTLRMLRISENYGAKANLKETDQDLNLGTIGSDFIDQHISLIDFKQQFMQITKERAQWMSDLPPFYDFDFEGRRLMLPCKIGKKNLKLFYDSGSSSFGLITTKNRFNRYTSKDEPVIQLDANRRGSAIPIVHKLSDQAIEIGGQNISLRRVSYVDMYAKFQRLITPFTRIGGWMGNLPFLDHAMIIDTKTEQFYVIKSEEIKS
jgi:hypothetical protein